MRHLMHFQYVEVEVDEMTLTQVITKELLESVGQPGGMEQVFRTHSRSKGPLYSALADATVEIRRRLESLQGLVREAEARIGPLSDEVAELDVFRDELKEQIQGLEYRVKESQLRLEEASGLLTRADGLAKIGLGEDELDRLAEILSKVAAEVGALPEESVGQFFETVARYGTVVSLDLETKRAETRAAQAIAEADRWEAEARLKEARSKARTSSIDLVEKLMAQGVKAQDLPQWQQILSKSATHPEDVAQSLESFSSLEALSKDRAKQAKALEERVSQLEIQKAALTKERDGVQAAVQALREKALREVKAAGQQLSHEIKEVVAQAQEYAEAIALAGVNYGNLRDEAAVLGEYIQVAKSLRSGDPEDWQDLPREVFQRLLVGLTMWARIEGRNVATPPPATITRRSTISPYASLSLWDTLVWALSGVFTKEERDSFNTGT